MLRVTDVRVCGCADVRFCYYGKVINKDFSYRSLSVTKLCCGNVTDVRMCGTATTDLLLRLTDRYKTGISKISTSEVI